jgi:hypothetical protein
MPVLSSRLGSWELEHLHRWSDRSVEIRRAKEPLLWPDTVVATIGSCFAAELARAMQRLRIKGSMHPGGLFYTSSSIRQELAHLAGEETPMAEEPHWKTSEGWVHPFKDYNAAFPGERELERWSADLDERSRALFRSADVVVVTLGLIEAWRNRHTGAYYRHIPHPDVFPSLDAEFTRLTVAGMRDDLVEIQRLVAKMSPSATLVVTVSPVPLQSTFTPLDVRVANAESKGRIRAAVSEHVEADPRCRYFPSYEFVTTAERLGDFMLEDGRHVRPEAVDLIVAEFMATFAGEPAMAPPIDRAWLTPPTQTAPTIHRPDRWRRTLRRLARHRYRFKRS